MHETVCLDEIENNDENASSFSINCVDCNKTFTRFNDLRTHKKTHLEKQFGCPKCDQKFNTFGALMGSQICLRPLLHR